MRFLGDFATFARPPSPNSGQGRRKRFLAGVKRNAGDAANVGWSTLGGASTMSIAAMHSKTKRFTIPAMVTGGAIGAGTALRQTLNRRKLEALAAKPRRPRKPKVY